MLINFQRYHRGPGVQSPDSLTGAAFHLHRRGGQERLHRRSGVAAMYARQNHLPNRGLKLGRVRRDCHVRNLDHVNSFGQRFVEPDPHVFRVHGRRERDLQVLGLTGRAGWRAAVIRDLGMR